MRSLHRRWARRAAPAPVLTLLLFAALPAWSQSSINISGYLDIGIQHKSGGSTSVGTLGRSNLAFSGSEDLGGGLKATFRLSTRFDLDTGTTEASDAARPFWKDEATVGLSGEFGALRLGRALSPLWAQAWAFDPWYNFDRIASPHWWQFAPDYLTNPQTREYARLNDGIFYDSPKLGGFHAHLSVGGDGGADQRARSLSASLNYDEGPLALMLSAERNSQKDRVLFLGAAYTVGPVRLMASYSRVDLDKAGVIYSAAWTNWAGASLTSSGNSFRRDAWQLGATYTVGQHTLRAGLGRDRQGATDGFNYIGSSFAQAGTHYSGPSTMASLGYVYALSKRTSLIADLSETSWKYRDDNGHKSATGYALGMSHSF